MSFNVQLKIEEALARRRDLFKKEGDNCFRLFNSSGDGIEGITADIYGEYILIQLFDGSLFGMEENIADAVVKTLEKLGTEVRGVLLKNRVKAEEDRLPELRKSGLIRGSLPPGDYTVLHNGLTLRCDLLDYQNTGVFMDMRNVRDALVPLYTGSAGMLNLFSHTGAFSVHALKHGIKECVNVDLSRSIHRRAKTNYALNGLSVDDRDFIAGDVQDWLGVFIKKRRTFSFIVYDPPTFSRNKRRNYRVKDDFKKHVGMLAKISGGGYVLTSINTFSIDSEEYLSFHPGGWEMVFLMHEAPDFSLGGEHYLKAGLWKTRS